MPRVLEGKVTSLKMANTVIVEVTRRTPHPMYRKLLKRSKNYKVAVNNVTVAIGDTVKMTETRRKSKDIYFELSEVVDLKKKEGAKK